MSALPPRPVLQNGDYAGPEDYAVFDDLSAKYWEAVARRAVTALKEVRDFAKDMSSDKPTVVGDIAQHALNEIGELDATPES